MVGLILILRLLHIVSGIFWVGAALVLTFFVTPAVAATQESGQKFMMHMMQKTPLSKVMTVSALTAVLAGLILYGIDSNWFTSGWIASGPGLGFGLGGISALIGLHFGLRQNRLTVRMAALGGQIQSQGGPPTAGQQEEIQSIQAKLKSGGMLNSAFLLLAAVLMATARFWVF